MTSRTWSLLLGGTLLAQIPAAAQSLAVEPRLGFFVPGAPLVDFGSPVTPNLRLEPGPLAEATRFDRFVAGAEANVAVGLVRLGHSTEFVGRVGEDGFGRAIRHRLRAERVGRENASRLGGTARATHSEPRRPAGLGTPTRRAPAPGARPGSRCRPAGA